MPQVFDLWQDPQERYDIFMNNFTERTWTMVTISEAIKELMKTYVKYPPRKLQSDGYTGPITLSHYRAVPVAAGAAREGGRQHPDADAATETGCSGPPGSGAASPVAGSTPYSGLSGDIKAGIR